MIYTGLFARLPDRLVVSFPNGDEVKSGDKKPAGSTVGECDVLRYI